MRGYESAVAEVVGDSGSAKRESTEKRKTVAEVGCETREDADT